MSKLNQICSNKEQLQDLANRVIEACIEALVNKTGSEKSQFLNSEITMGWMEELTEGELGQAATGLINFGTDSYYFEFLIEFSMLQMIRQAEGVTTEMITAGRSVFNTGGKDSVKEQDQSDSPLMDEELAEQFSHVNPENSECFGLDRTVTRVYAAYESASCGWKWYALEYEPKTGIFFGYVMGKVNEYGSFDIATLQNMEASRVPHWDNTRVMEEFEPQDPDLLYRDYREDTASHE